MARLRHSELVSNRSTTSVGDSIYRDPSIPVPQSDHLRSSPSSDKENQAAGNRNKSVSMADGPYASKRRRLSDRDGESQFESSGGEDQEEEEDQEEDRAPPAASTRQNNGDSPDEYDPYQDMEERRKLRKEYRDLDKQMHDERTEWIKPDSRSLEDAIRKQNRTYLNVKQTSEATLDSRILVNAGDLAYRRTKNLNTGNNATGIDSEEFIGKCITFMRTIAGQEVSATQRRRRAAQDDDDDEADADQGDALAWDLFGKHACLPFIKRPATMSFLLGPLSVQKAPRAPRQRRERLQRTAPVVTVEAKALRAEDLGQAQSSSVTAACGRVMKNFVAALEEGTLYQQKFWETRDAENMSDAEWAELAERDVIMDDGGLSLFKFTLHPSDFGQSVENIFYLSFLIKDDQIQLKYTDEGLPSLHAVKASIRDDDKRAKGERYQQIFDLDWPTWQGLVEANHIKRPMIPDRSADRENVLSNDAGWYN